MLRILTLLSFLIITSVLQGQTGKLIMAQQSVASFQLMKGDIIGIKTTLRKKNLESFLEKLLFIVQVGEASNVLPLGKPY